MICPQLVIEVASYRVPQVEQVKVPMDGDSNERGSSVRAGR